MNCINADKIDKINFNIHVKFSRLNLLICICTFICRLALFIDPLLFASISIIINVDYCQPLNQLTLVLCDVHKCE